VRITPPVSQSLSIRRQTAPDFAWITKVLGQFASVAYRLSVVDRFSQTSSRTLHRAAAQAAKPSLGCGAHEHIKLSNEGRAAILKGVDVLAKAVSITLEPKGTQLLHFTGNTMD
jgi:hypothetical protein